MVSISSFGGSVKNTKILTSGVVGNSDNPRSISHMQQFFESDLIMVNANRNNAASAALTLERDNDADLIQLAFEMINKS